MVTPMITSPIPFEAVCPKEALDFPWVVFLDDTQDPFSSLTQLVDFYCPTCDCHRTWLVLIDLSGRPKLSIAYGWKDQDFYQENGFDKKNAALLTQGFLDPLGHQSEDSEALFPKIIKIIKADKDRLNHRYELFRKTLAKNSSKYLNKKNIHNSYNVIRFSKS